jgi:hypothetical protein
MDDIGTDHPECLYNAQESKQVAEGSDVPAHLNRMSGNPFPIGKIPQERSGGRKDMNIHPG